MADLRRGTATSGDNATGYDQTYIEQKAIETLEDELLFSHYITAGEIPNNQGSTLRWLIDDNPSGATATNALTHDAGTPITFATRDSFNEDSFSSAAVEKQIETYGTFVPVRQADLDQMPKRMMDRLAERLAYRGADTKDTLLRAALDGSGTSFNPSMGAGTTNTRVSIGEGTNNTTLVAADQLTAEDVAIATGDLWARNVKPFSGGQFAALVHNVAATHMVTDVDTGRITWENMNKFVSGHNGQEKLTSGALGAILGTLVSRTNKITTATVDTIPAYVNLLLGKDALGDVHMGDMNPKVRIERASGTHDPYGMFATAAWTFESGPKMIDGDRCQILYSAV